MTKWNSSPHPISDIRDWSDLDRLELQPDFQRRQVWSKPAQIMLIDSIIKGIPIPKIFLANKLKNKKTYRRVIDGQQRISAILAFLRDEFPLAPPYSGPEEGKFFSELPDETQENILNYSIDFNEAVNPSDEDTREVYSRVNKYTVPLSKQELRRADYPGKFLNLSERLAIHDNFDHLNFFTAAMRRRYSDVEYVSELLAALLEGAQDKKNTLDDFYIKYSEWNSKHFAETEARFIRALDDIRIIFENWLLLSRTRFRNKADFYTLFTLVSELIESGGSLDDKDLRPLISDLRMLDFHIRPESDLSLCRDYAIKCVSQANSISSRKWRNKFLRAFLSGTYHSKPPSKEAAEVFYRIHDDPYDDPMCPPQAYECPICQVETKNINGWLLAWPTDETVFQLSNSHPAHPECLAKSEGWIAIDRPNESDYILR